MVSLSNTISTPSVGAAAPATPRLSVCLPTYNRASYLKATITSILAQTLGDFELIVADNCSTDDTPNVVAAFADPRIRYVRQDANIGHYRNMNAALDLSRGRYVCIVHDDDVYAPDFLARETEVLDRYPAVGMVHCAVRLIDSGGTPLGLHRVAKRMRIARGLEEFRRYLGGHDVCCSTVMCRREVWMHAGPFDPQLMCADWLMWLNVALRTDIAYLATPLVDVRVHDSSVSSTMDPMRWYEEFVEVTRRAIDQMGTLNVRLDTSLDRLRADGRGRQSRRFLIALLAASAAGDDAQVEGFLDVLRRLKNGGAPAVYWMIGRALSSQTIRPAMRAIRSLRRAAMRSRVALHA